MSYILEALKKSSEERARLVSVAPRTEPALASARHATRRSPWWLVAGIGIGLGALAVISFIGIGAIEPVAEPDRSPKPLPVAAEPAPARSPSPTPTPVRLDDGEATATASLKKLPPKDPDAERPFIVAPVEAPSPPRNKSVAKPPPLPALPTVAAAETPVPQAAPNDHSEMPPELLKQVLAIPISAHIYSSKPAERMVIIDGRGVREGDSLPSGVLVEQITPTGISVSYRGYRANKPVN